MASGTTGPPSNLPLINAELDKYALATDYNQLSTQAAAALGLLSGGIEGKLGAEQLWSASDNLDALWEPWIGGVTGAQGMPDGVSSAMMVQVEAGASAWQRLWISFGVDAGVWLQWGNEITGVWSKPSPLVPDALDAALARELRVQELQRRRGRTTTAKGVVVFVLDHGYSGFMNKAWPDLQARGFPVTWALNSVHPAAIDTGDTGLDWAAIKSLVASNPEKLEIAAHSATHGNVAEDPDALRAAIITHRTDLEALAGTRVDSWVQPGATLGDFVKDNPGGPTDYAGTRAGRMIAATYAAATGYILSPRTFKLDGVPDLGVVGNWVDLGVGNAMTYVNSVATNGGYTVLRLHPQYMDQSGYITRSQWQGFLDQVKALVDAGSIEVMTFRDASVATALQATGTATAPVTLSSTTDLDTLKTVARYKSISSAISGDPALHYPSGAVHGYLDVIEMGTGYVWQEWTDTWGQWTATRRFYAGAWTAWARPATGGTGTTDATAAYDAYVTAMA